MAAVRVVLADDHQIWRSGVKTDLGEAFFVVAEAGETEDVVQGLPADAAEGVATGQVQDHDAPTG